MSNLLLEQVVASYIDSWEGHTQVEGENFIRLRDRLKTATIEELNTEYNALTQQQLWNVPLQDLFYDEFLDRMLTETTFAISTTWHSIEQWRKNPFVLIRVGFEESYPLIDGDGSLILAHDPTISSYTLMNDTFSDKFQKIIIRLLLNHGVNAIVQVGMNSSEPTGRIQIIGLESGTDPDERISFIGDLIQSIPGETLRIKAKIIEAPDWSLYRQIYLALKNERPVIVDPMEYRLINQLIDVNKARDILENHGFTIEGNLVLEVEAEDDEYEEPIELL